MLSADPLSIIIIITGTGLPRHSIVMWRGLLCFGSEGRSLSVMVMVQRDFSGLIRFTRSSRVVSSDTRDLFRIFNRAWRCFWEAISSSQMDTFAWIFFNCLNTMSSSSSSFSFPLSFSLSSSGILPGWSTSRLVGLKCRPALVQWPSSSEYQVLLGWVEQSVSSEVWVKCRQLKALMALRVQTTGCSSLWFIGTGDYMKQYG